MRKTINDAFVEVKQSEEEIANTICSIIFVFYNIINGVYVISII